MTLENLKRSEHKDIHGENSSGRRRYFDARVSAARVCSVSATKCRAVGCGTEAMPLLETDQFDLLLTDIVMPEMDGIELAQKASAIDPEIRVMFITGFAAVALQGGRTTPGAKLAVEAVPPQGPRRGGRPHLPDRRSARPPVSGRAGLPLGILRLIQRDPGCTCRGDEFAIGIVQCATDAVLPALAVDRPAGDDQRLTRPDPAVDDRRHATKQAPGRPGPPSAK